MNVNQILNQSDVFWFQLLQSLDILPTLYKNEWKAKL